MFGRDGVHNDEVQFHIFAKKTVHSAVQSLRVTHYIACVDQSNHEFMIPSEAEMYVNLDIQLLVPGKLVAQDGSSLELVDTTTVFKNLLHSLFS